LTALLIPRVGARLSDGSIKQVTPDDHPAPTLRALGHDAHWWQFDALLVDGKPTEYGTRITVNQQNDPSMTIAATCYKNGPRALIDQAIVKQLNPRCLARLQGFPDWFKLPDVNYLAGKVVGNAVPPPFYEAIVGPLVNANEMEMAA
jgi:site-specific DNA-cytosine methylase